MMIFGRIRWGDYLFIEPRWWQSERSSNFALRDFEVLDLRSATQALTDIVRKDSKFFRTLHRDLLPHRYTVYPSPGSYEESLENERGLEALVQALGAGYSGHGVPPDFARIYVCRRKRVEHVPAPLPNPWKAANQAVEAARQSPRGYVAVETVTAQGIAVPQVQLEVLLADAQVLTRCTDSSGRVHLEPIPQGTCHILVPELDVSLWKPADGDEPTFTGRTARTRWHVVRQGECLTKIAARYGVNAWQDLWNHADNQALRKIRKSPHVLRPGDHVAVPGVRVYEIVRPTDETHRIEILPFAATIRVRVRVRDRRHTGLAGLRYDLAFMQNGSEVRRAGASPTGDDGLIDERVPVGTSAVAFLFIRPKMRLDFVLSELDPTHDEGTEDLVGSGIQARLRSLGYACDAGSDSTSRAVALFQRDHLGRDESEGLADLETCRKLAELYGV